MRKTLIVGLLSWLLTPVMLLNANPQRHRRHAGKTCGTERWAVKTLTDPFGEDVAKKSPMPNTVHGLRELTAPTKQELQRAQGRFPAESNTYRVSALILGDKLEADSDFHIVLGDPGNHSITMIAEIPSGKCVAPKRAKFFDDLRGKFQSEFGEVRAGGLRKLGEGIPACVIGVGFFDFLHGQDGVAPNGIELHPVLSIEKGFCK